jgi:PiT family inorganic phosphate transporter
MSPEFLLLICIVVLGLLFDYTNGFHDVANVVSTVIATRVLAPFTAIALAALLNFVGATHISGVAQTVTTGLIDPQGASQLLILCALIGAIVWNLVTWYFGIPSSSSYALVGGLVGAALVAQGSGIVFWSSILYKVVIPMIFSPIAGFCLAFLLMKGLQKLLCFPAIRQRKRIFAHLQIASASLVALSHGLNDAQKSMGIITLGLFSAGVIVTAHIPLWVILACALMMGIGTASGGFRVIRTVGFEITKLEPFQGFASELSASVVILIASFLGFPISSTHMIVGSITGVGAAKGARHVRWTIFKKLTFAWVITLPGSALVAGIFFKLFRFIYMIV